MFMKVMVWFHCMVRNGIGPEKQVDLKENPITDLDSGHQFKYMYVNYFDVYCCGMR